MEIVLKGFGNHHHCLLCMELLAAHPSAGTATSLTDTLHVVWSSVRAVLMMLMIAFGAATLGMNFRFYTIATMIFFMGFGYLTGLEAPKITLLCFEGLSVDVSRS